MKKKKKTNSYLEIPQDFNGFSFKEVKIRRAMLELKRETLKESIKHSVAEVKRSVPVGSSKSSKSGIGKFFSFGTKTAAVASTGKIGAIIKIASLSLEAIKFVQKIKDKRRAKRQEY